MHIGGMLARALLAGAVVLLLGPPAAASPAQLFGFGGRSPALGGTGVADARGLDAVYLNPAALGDVQGRHVTVGTLAGSFDVRGVERDIDDALNLLIGIDLNLPFGGALQGRVGFAVGVSFPSEVITRARAPRPGTPYYVLLESRTQTIGVHAGIGVRLTQRWAVGAGLLALGAVRGRLDIVSDAAGRIAATTEAGLVNDIAPLLGAHYRARSNLDLGMALRFKSQSTYRIDVDTDLGNQVPITIPPILLAGIAQYDPLTLAVEAAWRPRPTWKLTAQLAWEHWSDFSQPSENPIPLAGARPSPGFHDVVVPRLGAEWLHVTPWTRVAVRAGYFFAWSPAPEMTGELTLLDNHRHVFSLGLGWAKPRASIPLRVDAWVQLHALMPRTHDRPPGMADLDTGGAVYAGGLTVGVELQ